MIRPARLTFDHCLQRLSRIPLSQRERVLGYDQSPQGRRRRALSGGGPGGSFQEGAACLEENTGVPGEDSRRVVGGGEGAGGFEGDPEERRGGKGTDPLLRTPYTSQNPFKGDRKQAIRAVLRIT